MKVVAAKVEATKPNSLVPSFIPVVDTAPIFDILLCCPDSADAVALVPRLIGCRCGRAAGRPGGRRGSQLNVPRRQDGRPSDPACRG